MNEHLKSIIDDLADGTKKEVEITPRDLFNELGFERRTSNNCKAVKKFLEENLLEIEPDYNDVWIDNIIILKPKKKATRKTCKEPVKKLKILRAATQKPQTINNDSLLNEATTKMMLNKYSQLPVINGNLRNICGYISWETIGEARVEGVASDIVKDYISTNVKKLTLETPFLQAIKDVYENEFVLVLNNNELCGIVTMADISLQFLSSTEPFLLLEQIENQLRQIFDKKFLLEEIKKVSNDPTREIESLNDLTFGEYIRLIEDPKNWEKLNIKSIDKKLFIRSLDNVRTIRNDIMHFEPAGITEEQMINLKQMAEYLNHLCKMHL
jgi:predicted transcriptional regulator